VPERKRHPLARKSASSLRVALLEQQALVRDLLVSRLRAAGLHVVLREAEPEGLQAALERTSVDVVLLCLRAAPGSLELLHELAQRHPGLRLVVATPDPEPLFVERALATGASSVLNRRLQGSAALLRALRGPPQPTGSFSPRPPSGTPPPPEHPGV
jgi:DNA-binding NarL/FixJ family response regulator